MEFGNFRVSGAILGRSSEFCPFLSTAICPLLIGELDSFWIKSHTSRPGTVSNVIFSDLHDSDGRPPFPRYSDIVVSNSDTIYANSDHTSEEGTVGEDCPVLPGVSGFLSKVCTGRFVCFQIAIRTGWVLFLWYVSLLSSEQKY